MVSPDDWGSFLNYLGCLLGIDFSWSTSGSGQLRSSDNVYFQGCKSTNLPLEVVTFYFLLCYLIFFSNNDDYFLKMEHYSYIK